MGILIAIFALLIAACVVGCEPKLKENVSQPATLVIAPHTWSEQLISRDIHLTPANPVDGETGIQIASVSNNPYVRIKLKSGEILSGKVGNYLSCKQFGTSNLQIVAVSPRGEVWMRYMWSESTNGAY
jgi:hypothetical protein